MTARRGRPPEYDRAEALRAVTETFRSRGFAGTSLDDIASATGMNRPSLFAAFGNKKAMYLEALKRFQSAMIEAVEPALQQCGELSDVLGAFFDAAIRFYCKGGARGCLVLCTAPAEASSDEDIREALAAVLSQIEAKLGDCVKHAAAATGSHIVDDPAALTKLLTAILTSVALQSRAGVREPALRIFVRMALSAALPKPAGS
ncbi:TetR/AcrR family transcriptional regulator [Mesorhizobium sp. CO1-1-8]|nr:TetR/AcrR family transcriptional regulator [Mesorhizobium sp. CO1-1-8]